MLGTEHRSSNIKMLLAGGILRARNALRLHSTHSQMSHMLSGGTSLNIHDCVGRSNWMLWVPAQCINFGLVAQPYQVGRLVCCTLPVTAPRSAAATASLPALRIRPIMRLLTLATCLLPAGP